MEWVSLLKHELKKNLGPIASSLIPSFSQLWKSNVQRGGARRGCSGPELLACESLKEGFHGQLLATKLKGREGPAEVHHVLNAEPATTLPTSQSGALLGLCCNASRGCLISYGMSRKSPQDVRQVLTTEVPQKLSIGPPSDPVKKLLRWSISISLAEALPEPREGPSCVGQGLGPKLRKPLFSLTREEAQGFSDRWGIYIVEVRHTPDQA